MLLTRISTRQEDEEKGYKFVIYSGVLMYHFFSSNSEKAYKGIIKKLGFTLSDDKPEHGENVTLKWFNGKITESYFTKKAQLPRGAKPIKALSNGSIVTCYYFRDKYNLFFYRPNPNCKQIYKPLSLKQHIKHIKKHGTI